MQSMEEIYQHHAQTVYRYLLSLTQSRELAEELTQETFYQAVKSIHRFDGKSKVSTWLCSIAKNCYYVYLRKHPPTEEWTEGSSLVSDLESPDTILQKESRIELLRKLHNLNEDMREVIYLRIFGDLSFKEIGDILSKSENWARVTYYRGKEKLRKDWEDYEK